MKEEKKKRTSPGCQRTRVSSHRAARGGRVKERQEKKRKENKRKQNKTKQKKKEKSRIKSKQKEEETNLQDTTQFVSGH